VRAIMTELSPPGIYDLSFDAALDGWRSARGRGLDCRIERGRLVELAPEAQSCCSRRLASCCATSRTTRASRA
jgi:hypothetical protein